MTALPCPALPLPPPARSTGSVCELVALLCAQLCAAYATNPLASQKCVYRLCSVQRTYLLWEHLRTYFAAGSRQAHSGTS